MNNTIGVFFGSRSPEHDISILTAMTVIKGLEKLGKTIVPVYISKKGDWYCDPLLASLKFFSNPLELDFQLSKLAQVKIDFETSKGMLVLEEKKIFGKKYEIKLAFPCFHGSYGEDGSVQGIFEMFNLPYVGCDVVSSSVAMDKVMTKRVIHQAGIPTPDFVAFSQYEYGQKPAEILDQIQTKLSLPIYVKPPHLGSSIGITKVKNWSELADAVELALYYDQSCLVEQGVENLVDITCCIIGNNDLTASLLQASIFGGDFFDYSAKYLEDGGAQIGNATKQIQIPADIGEDLTVAIQETAKQVFSVLGCSGIARVDFLLDKVTNKFFINEVNTLPGTLYAHLWEKSGITNTELLNNLLDLANEKYASKNKINLEFKSEVLTQLGGMKGGKF